MKKKHLLLVTTSCYFNPLSLYWFDFAYQSLLDIALALAVSFCSSTLLLTIAIYFSLLKSKSQVFIFSFISGWSACILVLTAHSLEAGTGFAGYEMHGELIIIKYLLVTLMMPTFWINCFCLIATKYIEKRNEKLM